ncbi:PLD nuclease N-terminal domain-containing protein [Brevibacterium sp. 50QC2O2]|jgi:hypothetical protein|uniref:PLD nuclease N-terminal domain-containing protein n=1 Tax=Brevibacterium sp. 50QC2O2 TaxID=2968459 RepID=UPI00211C6318|nr:PLD nuclease N-terminal domain-containing protein [Brevibacterium sp. 50QC2O2]MCQ9389475.1 PLD nuclease N-terminal domain-containing protein [Brevibacterium sp. 50QC2O2]
MMYLASSAGATDNSGLGFLVLVFMGLAVIAWLALFIAALISIVMSPNLTLGGKLLWVIAVFAFPFLGSLVWFIWGRSAQLNRS